MSEHRRDPFGLRWVVIAPERARAAKDFLQPRPLPTPGPCPFCPGEEQGAPHEIRSTRGSDGWRVRVVPNRVPVLRVEEGGELIARGMRWSAPGLGAHEVVIETPRHGVEFSSLTEVELVDVLTAWQERIRDLGQDTRLRQVMVVRSEGPSFGNAPSHAHSQVVALPHVPHERDRELAVLRQAHESGGGCLPCRMLAEELDEGARVIERTGGVVAFNPWASRVPFETWVAPARHASHFEHESAQTVSDLARNLRSVLARLDRVLERPAWQLYLHTSPPRERALPWMDWRIEILPALSPRSALEWGGVFVNPVAPETAAEWLRAA